MSRRPRAVGGDRLRFIEFMLPTLVEQPPEGDDWIHEIKYDGYRTELLIEKGRARAFTRRGFDWSDKYPTIVKAAAELPVQSAIIDGEAIVLDENGVSKPDALRAAMCWEPERLIFVAFDLMHLNGEDLRFRPLIERKARLAELLMRGDSAGGVIQYSQHLEGHGAAFYDQVDRMGLEGMVSKRASSAYRSGRVETSEGEVLRGIDLRGRRRAARAGSPGGGLHGDARQGTPATWAAPSSRSTSKCANGYGRACRRRRASR